MKVKILSYNAVAAWRWDMPEDDDCGICRVQFDVCVAIRTNRLYFTQQETVMGQCTHSFHMTSIASIRGLTRNQVKADVQCVDKTVLIGTVFRIKGTADQSEAQPEQTPES
ncbi:hypothetical protein E4T39_02478 [Aureobasidium subglaciale]|nr:hypothetical protein E4T39_02478 [Aureobasidium subglaciale]